MKLRLFFVALTLFIVLTNIGNGCSPAFKINDPTVSTSLYSRSCASDESSLMNLSPYNLRRGYLGDKEVVYQDRGDGWILVESDKLYLTKNGRLPESKAIVGISQGVGVIPAYRWPSSSIPYVISSSLTNQSRVTSAIQHWNTNLSGVIQFVPRTNQSDYVLFSPATSGCAAPVGYYQGAGAHTIDLSDQCGSGNVAHEMGHIVGLDHEQNRLDRDQYVTINWGKITSGYSLNFNITAENQDYVGYDFGSIMHYSLSAFSVDGSNTITPKVTIPSGITVGQRSGLSSSDINAVRMIYGADPIQTGDNGSSTTPTSTTGGGLFGHYYEGIDFLNIRAERQDSALDFTWNGSPASGISSDYFSVKWMGWIVPKATGSYAFVINATDGYSLRINGSDMITNLSGSGYTSRFTSGITLNQGQSYPVVIQYLSKTGIAEFHWQWKKDGGTAVTVPADELIPDTTSLQPVCTSP